MTETKMSKVLFYPEDGGKSNLRNYKTHKPRWQPTSSLFLLSFLLVLFLPFFFPFILWMT